MSVINFQESLRARLAQMADEHMRMQEAIMDLPAHLVVDACAKLEQHSIELSRLAARLEGADAVPKVPAVPVVPIAQAPSFILPRAAGEERGGG